MKLQKNSQSVIIILAALLAFIVTMSGQAQFIFATNNGAITITGYTGAGGDVTIPDTTNGYLVTSVGDYAFQYNGNVTNLTVGNNVLSLGRNTFAYSTNLASVIIPNNVTNIVGGTFYDCPNLVNISLGNGIRSVGDSTFAFDAKLVALYFQGNAPNFVSLTSVFYGVSSATTIYYNAGTTGWAASYDALSTKTIQSQFGYSSNGQSITITNYAGAGGAIAIPAAITGLPVTAIGYGSFYDQTSLTSVTIPNSVTNIVDEAFTYCSGLTSAAIPNGVISIGSSAFNGCSGLTSVVIPKSVISIGQSAFEDCSGLTGIAVDVANSNYTSAGGILFNKTLTTLIQYPGGFIGSYTIPSSVTNIGETAFAYSGLTSVTIPSSVTGIGELAFYECPRLTTIAVDIANSNYASVGGVLFNKTLTTLIQYPIGLGGNYLIPNSVNNINEFAFSYCLSLTSVTIPDSVASIGQYTFLDCSSLTSVVIPDSVTNISFAAFSSSGLTNLSIGDSVTKIPDFAFAYCLSLTSVTIPNGVTNIGQYAFHDCSALHQAYFLGNEPDVDGGLGNADSTVFNGQSGAVYYLAATTGWGSTFGGWPTSLYFSGNLAANWGFETGNFSGWTTNADPTTQVTNSAAHSGAYGAAFSESVLEGDVSTLDQLKQTLSTQNGSNYLLSFWVNGVRNSIGGVAWNGINLMTNYIFVPSYNVSVLYPGWTNYQFVVTATGTNTVLQFTFGCYAGASMHASLTYLDDISVVPLAANFYQVNAQLVNGSSVQLSFLGLANQSYALDRTFNLAPPVTWIPQSTNATDADGMLLLTNTPISTTNNFWRIRSVP